MDSNYLIDVHNFSFLPSEFYTRATEKNLKSSLPIWGNAKQLEYIYFPVINLKGLVMFSTCHMSNAL